MNHSTDHTRVNDILLGPLERPALKWLAAHTPARVDPDAYTAIGVLGSLLVLIGYLLSRYHPAFFWLASFGLLVNWLGDSLDGTLARYRHIERPVYGFFIDHITDTISMVLVFVGLGLSPYVNFSIACLTLVAYLSMSILAYVRTIVAHEFKISYGKLGPTEGRLIIVILNTVMFFLGAQVWQVSLGALGQVTFNLYDLGIGGAGLVLLTFFLTTSIQQAMQLAAADQ